MALDHGGRLRQAARAQGISSDGWLDLSTGISPWSWPVPRIPEPIWRRLPEEDDGLDAVCRQWLGVAPDTPVLPIAGSQAVIQHLPRLRKPCRVAVPDPAYAEHGHCWALSGHEVHHLSPASIDQRLDQLDVVVWVQPNNPSGATLPGATLSAWHERLQRRGGWLIIDEAFIQASDADSLIGRAGESGLIILRSIGKFFGLAGIRGGVMAGPAGLVSELGDCLGPWSLSGPTRWIMKQALNDQDWQKEQQHRLMAATRDLVDLLEGLGLKRLGGCDLFQTFHYPDPVSLHSALASRAILLRAFPKHGMIRFGLPPTRDDLTRLEQGLRLSASLNAYPARE